MKINEEEDFNLIARTNNVCEFYNYILNQKMKITNPRLSILVSFLLNEELEIREYITKSTVNVFAEQPIPNGFVVQEDQIPIGSLTKLIEKKEKLKPMWIKIHNS